MRTWFHNHANAREFLIGLLLLVPLLLVCGFTPALSFFVQPATPGTFGCVMIESYHDGTCDQPYTPDDGVMFQVWGKGFYQGIISTDWGLTFLNIGKGVLIIVAVLLACSGILFLIGAGIKEPPSQTENKDREGEPTPH